jgi:hypothetical protein
VPAAVSTGLAALLAEPPAQLFSFQGVEAESSAGQLDIRLTPRFAAAASGTMER